MAIESALDPNSIEGKLANAGAALVNSTIDVGSKNIEGGNKPQTGNKIEGRYKIF